MDVVLVSILEYLFSKYPDVQYICRYLCKYVQNAQKICLFIYVNHNIYVCCTSVFQQPFISILPILRTSAEDETVASR